MLHVYHWLRELGKIGIGRDTNIPYSRKRWQGFNLATWQFYGKSLNLKSANILF